jgi:hypothetical protein
MDLGREIEVVTDRTKSRLAGFHEYQPTLASFLDLFARLRRESIIPAMRRAAGKSIPVGRLSRAVRTALEICPAA